MVTVTPEKIDKHCQQRDSVSASVEAVEAQPEAEVNPDYQDPDFKTATMSRWPPWVGNRCVKVKRTPNDVQVQDSKLGEDSPTLSFTHAEWRAFLNGVRNGEFDLAGEAYTEERQPVTA